MNETWMCATDLSPASEGALREAARLAHAVHGDLVVLHVHAVEHLPEEEQTGERTFLLETELRRSLDRLAVSLRDAHPGLRVTVDVAGGEPVPTILEEAKRVGASRIVVGTHGRKGVAHVVLGSVAEAVVRRSDVPVFVVKAGAT
jgi:nucleotide-binding universal stress UspA family protein